MVIYGPPGTGKTTLASIIAKTTNKNYIKLNGTNVGVKEIRDAIEIARWNKEKNGTILYLERYKIYLKSSSNLCLNL